MVTHLNSWLYNLTEAIILNNPLPIGHILKDSLYYPACYFDGGAVKISSKEIQSYVYCDYSISEEKLLEQINTFYGYHVIAHRPVRLEELVPNGCVEKLPQRLTMNRRTKEDIRKLVGIQKMFAHWAVYERDENFDDTHGAPRFSLLHICGEGVATYHSLYWSNRQSAKSLAIIQPGNGFGGNWTDFRRKDQPLAWVVLNNPYGTPDTILYGGIGPGYTDFAWDDYFLTETISPYYSGSMFGRPHGRVTIWKKQV